MKKFAIDGSLVILAAGAVVTTTLLANMYLTRTAVAPNAAKCTKQGVSHFVTISAGTLSEQNTVANLCDTLTILNKDSRIRLIAFGPHEQHVAYDGITEQVLAEGQGFTIVLNKLGTYSFHDHDDETVAGTFTVTKN